MANASEFLFAPDQSIPAAKYEYVNMLPAAPRNVKDYHDLENIIRYRTLMLVKELYGNCRVAPATLAETFQIAQSGGSKYVEVTGTWYVDGYRIWTQAASSKDSASALVDGNSYQIWMGLVFNEITYNEDSSIGLQDPGTKQYVPTSTRIEFVPVIILQPKGTLTPPVLSGYNYFYHIGDAEWNAVSMAWNFADGVDFTFINTKYNVAIDTVNKAVHKEADGKTVKIKKFTTNTTNPDVASPNIYIEEISDQKITVGLESLDANSTLKTFAAFEMIFQDNEWQPILWMRPAAGDYPVSYMTPDGFKSFDNKGNALEIDYGSIVFGNKDNQFIADTTEFFYKLNQQIALWARLAAKDWRIHIGTVSPSNANVLVNDADPKYSNAASVSSGVVVSGNQRDAVYVFDLGADSTVYPSDGIVQLNHKLMYTISDLSLGSAIISAKIDVSGDNISWTSFLTERWIFRSINNVYTTPLNFSVKTDAGTVNRYVRVSYSISPIDQTVAEVTGKISLKTSAPFEWGTYTVAYTATQVQNLVMNGHVLHVDNNGKLLIKKLANSFPSINDLGDAIDSVVNSSPGTVVTDPGGKEVGATDLSNVAVGIDNTKNAYTSKDVNNNPVINFPVLNTSMTASTPTAPGVDQGLVSIADYKNIMSKLGLSGSITPSLYPNGANSTAVQFVAPTWSTTPSDLMPFTTDLQVAVNRLNAVGGGTVFVYPGYYTPSGGVLNLVTGAPAVSGYSISIVAIEPKNTLIYGSVQVDSAGYSRTAYLDIPIQATGVNPAIIQTEAGSTTTCGPNGTVSSVLTGTVIRIDKGQFESNALIYHDNATAGFATILLGQNGTDTANPTIRINGNIGGRNPKGFFDIRCGTIFINGNINNDVTRSGVAYLIDVNPAAYTNIYINGSIISTDSSVTSPASLGVLRIQNTVKSTSVYLNGLVQRFSSDYNVDTITVGTGVHCVVSKNIRVSGAHPGYVINNSGDTTAQDCTLYADLDIYDSDGNAGTVALNDAIINNTIVNGVKLYNTRLIRGTNGGTQLTAQQVPAIVGSVVIAAGSSHNSMVHYDNLNIVIPTYITSNPIVVSNVDGYKQDINFIYNGTLA